MSDFDEAADMAKYDAMRSELEAEGRLEPREPQVAEEHTIAQPTHQERHQDYEPQDQYQQQGIPHPYEDPIQHFSTRATRVENHLQHQAIMDAVQKDEKAAEAEMADYWDACAHLENARVKELERMIPDGQQGNMLARSHGFRTAAEARQAHLERDRQLVIAHAAQTGQSPAALYYHLATQKGYRPTTVPRSIRQRVTQAKGEKDFDAAWSQYEKAARRADENYRARR